MNNHSPKIEKSYTNEKVISEKLKIFSEKDREDNLEKIRRIILESAMEQFIKENELNKINDFNENLIDKKENVNKNILNEQLSTTEFFDF